MAQDSNAPQNMQRLAQLIRRKNGDSGAAASKVVPHPAILPAKLSDIDDPLMVLALLEGKQRDLHTDIQTINRVTHRATAQNLERITGIERNIEQLLDKLRTTERQAGIAGQQLDILLPSIDGLRAEVELIRAQQERLGGELVQQSESFNQLLGAVRQIAQRRFTTTHILLIITSVLVVGTVISGQLRYRGFASLQHDVRALYENDTHLQQQILGR